MKMRFSDTDCNVIFGEYAKGGGTAIQLYSDDEYREPVATASVNLVGTELGEGEIAIKDYSENTGMLYTLIDAGIVSEPVRFETSGLVSIPICKLLIEEKDA
jgi:hypothetical protein